jgi:hypothetical protein
MEAVPITAILLALALLAAWLIWRRRARIDRERRRQTHNGKIRRDWDIMQKAQRDEAKKR